MDLEKGEEPEIKLQHSLNIKSKGIPEKYLLMLHWISL